MERLILLATLLSVPVGAEAQDEARRGGPWPDRLGPAWVGGPDARFRPGLAVQLQGQSLLSQDMTLGVRVRRIRPSLRTSFLGGLITTALQLEANPASAELIDAWVEATPRPGLHLRAGQMKTPFTLYFQRSLTQLPVDWPLVSYWFGGERQLGLMAHGEHDESGLRYALGLFGGQNRRATFSREIAQLYGGSLGNPSRFVDAAPDDAPHPELFARVGHGGEGIVGHEVALSFAWDSGPVRQRDYVVRIAPELQLTWSDWTLHTILYAGFLESATDGVELGTLGAYAELSWRAHRHLELVLRYSRVHLLPYLIADARRQRAEEDADLPHARHELALALNTLIVGRSLEVQTDLAWLRAEGLDGSRDDLRLRVQMQVAF